MKKSIIILAAGALLTVGCQTNTGKGAGIGAATGAILGGIIGHQSGKGLEGAAIGAAGGGAVGAAVGASKRCRGAQEPHASAIEFKTREKQKPPEEGGFFMQIS
jgi:predicted small secreted protein